MTNFSRASARALIAVTVVCAPLLAYQLSDFKSTSGTNLITGSGTSQQKNGSGASNILTDEPEIAAANPVSAQSWTILPNIRNGRFESTGIQYRDDLYVFNGFGQGIDVEPTVEKFDAGSRTWSVINTTSIARGNAVTHNGVIVNGNEAWMIGGRVGDHPGRVTSKIWKFNLTTHKWSEGPQLPVPVAAGGGALVDNRIHWFGGLDANASCDVANHYVYDLDNPSAGWSDISGIAPMPVPRNHFATIVHEGLIYAIGGQFTHGGCGGGTPDTDLVHVFNPKTNTWTQVASLPAVQSHTEPSSFVHKGAIYVVGGATDGNKVYRYDPSTDDWDTVAVLPQALLAPIARVVDNQLVVSSGGAPATVPSLATYTTDMTPLLLPGANNTNNTTDTNNNAGATDTGATDTVATVSDPATVSTGEPGMVSLEAEFHDTLTATDSHQWISVNLAGASNNAAMITTPDNNKTANGAQGSPSMAYFAYFNQPGTWYLWVRGSGDTVNGEGSSDSMHAGLDGNLANTADKIDNFPSDWSWSNSTRDGVRASLNIPTAEIHTVNLWMREDGLAVDKILLTTDPAFVPTGVGLQHNDGTTATSSQVEQVTVDNDIVSANSGQVAADPTDESESSETISSTTTINSTATTGLIRNEDTMPTGSQDIESESTETSNSVTTSINSTSTDSNRGGGSQHLIDLVFLLVVLGYLTITQLSGKQHRSAGLKRSG